MKIPKKEYVWALALVAGMLMLMLYWGEANATGCYKCTTNIFNEGDTYIEEDTVSSSDLAPGVAQAMAADAIHCTTSTRKHQMGLGAGYKAGKNGGAIGYCKTHVTEGGTPYMLGVKAAGANDTKPAYSVGVNWTF